MNETVKKILLLSGQGKRRYGTAGTTTQTTLASSGGLLINIDSATGDIAQTASGWIEDEKYGFYAVEFATSTSSQFKTGVITGEKVLRLELLDITGRARVNQIPASNYATTATNYQYSAKLIPIKPNTKYKFKIKARFTLSSGSGPLAVIEFAQLTTAGVNTTAITGISTSATDFTYIERSFTSAADGAFLGLLINTGSAGGIGYADFQVNSMTLEEVVEPVANSLTSSSPSLVSFTAVGSTDNIDQSLDTGGAAAFTYVPLVAISEAAIDRQTFVPTKSKITRIGVWVVAKGTGNWTLTIHDSSNVVRATATIANASLTNGAFNYFTVPANVTALASYHFHVTSTVLDGTLKSGVALDMEGASYIENYYKPTTNFKASQNNISVSISADEDGFNDGTIINISNGAYTDTKNFGSLYTGNLSVFQYLLSSGLTSQSTNYLRFDFANEYITLKFQAPTGFTFGDIAFGTKTVSGGAGGRPQYIDYSYNNSTWTNLSTVNTASTTVETTFTIPGGNNTVYVRYLNGTVNNANFVYYYNFVAPINLSSLPTLRNYPTNKDIIKQYSTTLGSPTTTATYRATKWGFPAIEYSSTEYQYLDIDTTATGSTVAFSELGTSFTTVVDGASLAITSTSTPSIWVKTNITANRLYLSSNDYNTSSDKDGSLKQSVVYSVIQ